LPLGWVGLWRLHGFCVENGLAFGAWVGVVGMACLFWRSIWKLDFITGDDALRKWRCLAPCGLGTEQRTRSWKFFWFHHLPSLGISLWKRPILSANSWRRVTFAASGPPVAPQTKNLTFSISFPLNQLKKVIDEAAK